MFLDRAVSALLNQFLGTYIENLDREQLKIGLLAGDLVLNNLRLRESALDNLLDLPIRPIAGHIEKLSLKFSWYFLKHPTRVHIKGLSLLASPTILAPFNAEKDKEERRKVKKQQLANIEASYRALLAWRDNPHDQNGDTFLSRLLAHFMQNLAITIEDVHVRYEDAISNPGRPFACGFRLKAVALQTTNSSWEPTDGRESAKYYCKLITLDSLEIYWQTTEKFQRYTDEIVSGKNHCFKDSYILNPISFRAKLRMSSRPDPASTSPNIHLNLALEKFSLSLTADQLQDIISLWSCINRRRIAAAHRKYRPTVASYTGQYRLWWQFAIKSILKEVRERRKSWSWFYIKEHRAALRRYMTLYKILLTSKNEDPAIKKSVEEFEDRLDVFNIILARRQVEYQVDQKYYGKVQKSRGWFSWLFGRSSALTIDKLKKEMTPEEKQKLYDAIGYEENEAPITYPKTFIKNLIEFELDQLRIYLHDSPCPSTIMTASLDGIRTTLIRRLNGFKTSLKLRNFSVDGTPQDGLTPRIIRPLQGNSNDILKLDIEAKPLEEICDYRVHLAAEPLLMDYDSNTIKGVTSMFPSAKKYEVTQMKAAAWQELQALKKRSTISLEHVIKHKAIVDISIAVKGPYVMLPYEGRLGIGQRRLFCYLGNLQVESRDIIRRDQKPCVSEMARVGIAEESIEKEMTSRCYDKYSISLSDIQVISIFPEEDWRELIKQGIFMLKPTNITFMVEKCLVVDDLRLPKLIVKGTIPEIGLDVNDNRFKNALAVIKSLPLYKNKANQNAETIESSANRITEDKYIERLIANLSNQGEEPNRFANHVHQGTNLVIEVGLKKAHVNLSATKNKKAVRTVASFSMEGLKANYVKKTLDQIFNLKLKEMSIDYVEYVGNQTTTNSLAASKASPKDFLTVCYVDADKLSFDPGHLNKAILKKAEICIGELAVTFHQETIISLLGILDPVSNTIRSQIEAFVEKAIVWSRGSSDQVSRMSSQEIHPYKEKAKELPFEGRLALYQIQLQSFQLIVAKNRKKLSEIAFSGLEVSMDMLSSQAVMRLQLKKFAVLNPDVQCLYNIISMPGELTGLESKVDPTLQSFPASSSEENAVQLVYTMYNEAAANDNYVNPKKVDLEVMLKLSRIRIVFLKAYIENFFLFINNFHQAMRALAVQLREETTCVQQVKELPKKLALERKVSASPTLLRLKIHLDEPCVIVPQLSGSTEALLLNFKYVSINSDDFKKIVSLNQGQPALLDIMHFKVDDANVHLVSVERMRAISSRLLFNITYFNLNLTRNLTSAWYFDDPDDNWDAQVGEVNVSLSQLAYMKALEIAWENLCSSVKVKSPDGIQQVVKEDMKPEVAIEYEGLRIKNRFNVSIKKFQLELFKNADMNISTVFDASLEKQLTLIAAQNIELCGHRKSDASLQAKASVRGLSLEDTRLFTQRNLEILSQSSAKKQIKRPISRLFYPTELEKIIAEDMLLVVIDKDRENNVCVEVRLREFTFVLYRSFLKQVIEFFSCPSPWSEQTIDKKLSDLSAKAESLSAENTSDESSNQARRVTCLLQIQKPYICLVERFDSPETNAIVLHFDMEASLLTILTCGQHDVSAKFHNFQIFSCPFDATKRQRPVISILKPTNMEMKAKILRKGEGAIFVNAHIGTAILNVSPAMVLLLSVVKKRITGNDDEEETAETREAKVTETVAVWDNFWQSKPLDKFKFPFLDVKTSDESPRRVEESDLPTIRPREKLKLTCDSIEMFLETGQGDRISPLILLESKVIAFLKNWSHALEANATLTLQAGYYNSVMASWEPLIEPVDCTSLGIGKSRPWEMNVTMKRNIKNSENNANSLDIKFESSDILDVTVTKSFLEVWEGLGIGLSNPTNQKLWTRAARYIVHNKLDKCVVVDIASSDFLPADSSLARSSEIILEPDSKIDLELKTKDRSNSLLNDFKDFENDAGGILHIRFPELSYERGIPVSHSCMRYLAAGNKHGKVAKVGIISEICNDFGFRSITLRSIVQIRNHFHIPIDIWCPTKVGNERVKIGQIEAGGAFDVPPSALYNPTEELFFAPAGFLPVKAFLWRELQHLKPDQEQPHEILKCTSSNLFKDDSFYIQVNGEVRHILFENTTRKTSQSLCYTIRLRPAVLLHNSLPVPLHLIINGRAEDDPVQPGISSVLSAVQPGFTTIIFKLKGYMDMDWTCKLNISPDLEEFAVMRFNSSCGSSLTLGTFSRIKDFTLDLTVYCPFWMINNTGLRLSYKRLYKAVCCRKDPDEAEIQLVEHPGNLRGPVLFSYGPKMFFQEKHAHVRVEDSQWSAKFPMEAAKNSGLVMCKSQDGSICYKLGVSVAVDNEGLTKQVIFTPYHILSNLTDHDIEVCEVLGTGNTFVPENRDDWILIPSNQSIPFWPRGSLKLMIFRIAGTREITLPLSWENPRRTLLQLDNAFVGIDVDFQTSDSSIVVICQPFEEGRAPLLLINCTRAPLAIREVNEISLETELPPQYACYYTWKQPNGSRSLSFGTGSDTQHLAAAELTSCISGSFDSSAYGPIRWIIFLHDRQRVLLITSGQTLPFAHVEQKIEGLSEMRFSLSLHGLGLSVVNNMSGNEILYAAVTSSGVVWEKARRSTNPIYRSVPESESKHLEDAYQQYRRKMATLACNESVVALGDGSFVDFEEMKTLKPKERLLRRTYKHGCELKYVDSGNKRLLQFSVYRLQIDNQLDDCVFPLIFAPVPPPQSLHADTIPPPFFEFRIVELSTSSAVKQFDSVELNIKECRCQPDKALVNALDSLFAKEGDFGIEREHGQNFALAMEIARKGLHERTRLLNNRNRRVGEHYVNKLRISPLKMHLSFSMSGEGDLALNNSLGRLLHLLSQSTGSTLTEIQDVIFEFNPLDRSSMLISWEQLLIDLKGHYHDQAYKQLYVLVFGLDVIGNPSSLVRGLGAGVRQFFNEPFQGFLHGPDEFVEGLNLGAKSLVGNTLGAMAGAASRITGTIGKGLSFLTFDEEYQKKRRAKLLRRPSSFGDGLVQSGKDLFVGVFHGFTGIIMRPIEGAKKRGVVGFVTGVGKGMIGVVARTTAAVVDFTSGSLHAMKKLADFTEDVPRLRPPRHIQLEAIVRPYSRYQADGKNMLKLLNQEKFARDEYVDHVSTLKGVLLVTNLRLVLVEKTNLGHSKVDSYTWEDLAGPPILNPKGLFIPIRAFKKVFNKYASNESGILVEIEAPEKCEVIVKEVLTLMKDYNDV